MKKMNDFQKYPLSRARNTLKMLKEKGMSIGFSKICDKKE